MVIFYGICKDCGCNNKVLSFEQQCQDCSYKTSNQNQQCLNGEKSVEGGVVKHTPSGTTETPDKVLADNTSPAPADIIMTGCPDEMEDLYGNNIQHVKSEEKESDLTNT